MTIKELKKVIAKLDDSDDLACTWDGLDNPFYLRLEFRPSLMYDVYHTAIIIEHNGKAVEVDDNILMNYFYSEISNNKSLDDSNS